MTGRRPNEARPSDAPRPEAWRIDYRAGSHPTEFSKPDQFSHEDGEPWEAPGQYAVYATYLDEDGNRREVSDEPFIIYLRTASPGCTEGTFVGGDEGGLRDREVDGESIAVYSGKWLPDADFERIRKQARFDRRFPASLDDRAGVIAELQAAAADSGRNVYHVIMQAIFRARNLGYPQDPFIDDLVEDALFAAMQARREG
jgi:hypothetical protein